MTANPAEQWRPVPGYEGVYEVSDLGSVRSVPRVVPVSGQVSRRLRGRILSPAVRPSDGRRHVTLCRRGKLATRTVHRLMREAGFKP
jgi:hypothetical protein